MFGYIVRRVLQIIPVFIGTTLLIYFLVFALPGDPLLALFGDKTPNPAVLERLREQYHLNEPFIVQYWYYISGIFHGDFGTSFNGQPVSAQLVRAFPITIRLAVLAVLIELIVGITVGLVAGLRKGSIFDGTSLIVSLVLISLPIFVIGFTAQFTLAIKAGWFRTTVSQGAPLQDLILPALVLASVNLAVTLRLTRASVLDTGNQDFVRMAYGKGLPTRRVIPVHILRNSLIPVTTSLAADFGILIVGATVTEGIFNIAGVGGTLFRAIKLGENPTVVSFVTVMVILYLIVNLLIDLLYAVLDPRIRYVK
ncbi:MAG: transporter permease [Schumannella sp.]|jgi:oligopeptide transport system permease protein|nr:transporter permease [Schumannella sp.]